MKTILARLCAGAFGIFIAAIVIAPPVRAQTVATKILDFGSGGSTGLFTSQAIVNGNPAIAYMNGTDQNLMFARNSAADGSGSWSVATIDSTGNVGAYTSLLVVNGNPAISYHDSTNGDLKYVRANDVNGTSWGTPVTVDSIGTVGWYTSLAVVNGNPAISYYDQTNADLKYVRALDTSGSSWGTAVTLDSTAFVGSFASLEVVNGNPAISYSGAGLKYMRALDANGTNWGTPVIVDASGGQYASLLVVNGNPAISYLAGDSDLKYVRASDASGSSWSAPVTLDSTGEVGHDTSLAVVDGNAAISYYDNTNNDLKYVRANDASGTSWDTPVTLDSTGVVGAYTSLAVVAGNPAISYHDQTNGDLKYVRASDASGTSWPAGAIADAGVQSGIVGRFTSQMIVNGNPAISYLDPANSGLKYLRANDASGTSWGTPLTVASTGGSYVAETSLAVVNGNPAISYYDQTNGDLKYVRANDASGTSWGTPLTVASTGASYAGYTSLREVNGNPAISYYDYTTSQLRYVRASDASGTTWGAPVIAATGNGLFPSLVVVNGNPAIGYYGAPYLKFVRALDASGTSWGAPVTIDSTGNVGSETSMAVVAGNPAISYYDQTNGDLKYARANDASGASWGTSVTLDSTGVVGRYPSLEVVNGNPAISYYDQTNADLKYVRANDASGTSWGTLMTLDSVGSVGEYSSLAVVSGNPAISYYDSTSGDLKWATIMPPALDITVTQATVLSDGASSVAYGTVPVGGSSAPLTFTIGNSGSADLTGLAVSGDGTNPGDFTVNTTGMLATVTEGNSTTFTISFIPLASGASGARSAAIHIASNVVGSKNPFDFNVTGTAVSYTHDADGDGMNDAAEFLLAALGFNWQAGQPALVSTYYTNANAAGLYNQTQYNGNYTAGQNAVINSPNTYSLYTLSQVQALNVGVPLLTKNPTTGKFKLTIGIKKTANLVTTPFTDFPFTGPDTTINGQGKVEFEFTVPGNAAFFRLESQ